MPTYDYACDTCKKAYELREAFTAESTHACKKCGKGTAKRQLTAPAIVFKGSGFYVTDSSKSSSTTLPGETSGKNGDSGTDSPASDAPSTAATTADD